ncbi:MAG: hypothetical protein IT168_17540 [Bryobacterales bacterium]|nr:hypothetical protein [Bryobacterales bacterium]
MSRTGMDGGWLGRWGLPLAVVAAVVAAVQWHAGAYSADLLGDLDEPAHYVTTRMVYEYLRAPFSTNPIRHAEQFYLHFPLVGIGHWPPGLYAIGAIWEFIAGPGTPAMLVLMAGFGSLAALLVYAVSSKLVRVPVAVAATLLFALMPAFQQSVSSVMGDLLALALVLAAVLWWVRAVNGQRTIDAWLFAAAMVAAVMIKPIALAGFAVLLVGFWRLRRRGWVPIVFALAICAGYQVATAKMAVGMVDKPTYGKVLDGFVSFLQSFPRQLGWVAVILALAGLLSTARSKRRTSPYLFAALTVLGGATVVLVLITNVGGALFDRYYFAAYVPAVAFAAVCVNSLWDYVHRGAAGIAILLSLALHPGVLRPYTKPVEGFHTSVLAALRGLPARSVIVVGANGSTTEQVLIGELARSTPHARNLFTVRSSQLLTESDWFGRGYKLLFDNANAIEAEFRRIPVNAVLLYTGGPDKYPHFELLLTALAADPQQWERTQPAPKFVLYRRREPLIAKLPQFRLKVNGLGGRELVPLVE